MSQAQLVILSGPSGVGKGTLAECLMKMRGFERSTSHTTRPPRNGEQHGREYWFLPNGAEFVRRRGLGEYAEWSQVADNFYGTPAESIARTVHTGGKILFDIDVNGRPQLENWRYTYPDQLVRAVKMLTVFILPPGYPDITKSLDVLERRLRGRGDLADHFIARRLAIAPGEMARAGEFQKKIVNDDREAAARELIAAVDEHFRP